MQNTQILFVAMMDNCWILNLLVYKVTIGPGRIKDGISRNSNPVPTDYDAAVFPTRSWRSVYFLGTTYMYLIVCTETFWWKWQGSDKNFTTFESETWKLIKVFKKPTTGPCHEPFNPFHSFKT
jgi:hypothetical protein